MPRAELRDGNLSTLAVAAILAVGGLLRWELLGVRSLWYDEGYSLFVARMGWRGILDFLRHHDAHPAGYYLLLSLWTRWFGESLVTARFPSFAFGVVAVALTWVLGRRLHSSAAGAVAALLVATHPFQVVASNEMRMYSLLTVLVLGSVLCTLRAAESGGWWAVLLGVLWAAVGYTSYYGLLGVTGMAAWLLTRGHRRPLLVAAATASLLYGPWVPYLAGFWRANPQLWTREALWWGYPAELVAAQTFGGYWPDTFTYHTSFRPDPLRLVPLVAPYLLFAAAATQALRSRRTDGLSLSAWTWGAVHGGVLLVSLVLGWVAAYPRHLVFVQPLAACWVAAGLVEAVRMLPVRPSVALVGAAAWLLSLQGSAVGALQSGRYETYRYDLAARFVAAAYRPGDAVVYVPDGTSLAFEYYFRPPGKRLEVDVEPRPYRREEWLPLFREALHALGPQDRRVWVVTTSPAPPLGEAALRLALTEAGYEVVGDRAFPGLKVSLVVRQRPNPSR